MKLGLIAAATLAAVAMPAMAQMGAHTTEIHHDRTVHTSAFSHKRTVCSTHWGPHHQRIRRCWKR